MTKLEFVTSDKIDSLTIEELYDFIIARITNNSILILEKNLGPMDQMNLIAKGMESATDGIFVGIKIREIKVSAGSNGGFLRGKPKEITFNLLTPGTSSIIEKEEGYYSIVSNNGNEISAYV